MSNDKWINPTHSGARGVQTHSLVISPVPRFTVVTGKTSSWQIPQLAPRGKRIFMLRKGQVENWNLFSFPIVAGIANTNMALVTRQTFFQGLYLH